MSEKTPVFLCLYLSLFRLFRQMNLSKQSQVSNPPTAEPLQNCVNQPFYPYVGPEIFRTLRRSGDCIHPETQQCLLDWLERQLGPHHRTGQVTATFIIDTEGRLWVADRRSEHIACADGGSVLAAGEMIIEKQNTNLEVAAVTNQSAGFCPEPECWSAIAMELDRLRLPHPDGLSHEFRFRRCPACSTVNLIKDSVFECDVCGEALPASWNFLQP